VDLDRLRARLREDFPFYARAVLKVNDRGTLVPFVLRPAQHDLWSILAQQRANRQPMGAVILKARKLGFSTFAQGLLLQRTTLIPMHSSAVIAHNAQTAGVIMQMAELMYANLPDDADDEELEIKPQIANRRRHKEIVFGNPDRFAGASANLRFGANRRTLVVDTAREFEGGRGNTLRSVHGSEVAFWPDLKRKLTALRSAVDFTDPESLVLLESTANGHNEFKGLCDQAINGEGDYPLFFAGWHADARYRRGLTAREADAFEIRDEDEHELTRRFDLSPEQLNWRRWAIEALCQGDVNVFRQEYPSFPEEAFIASGQTVFGGILIQKAISQAREAPEPERVTLTATTFTSRKTRRGSIDVPTTVSARPDGPWEIWERPRSDGQYVIACDPASGDVDERDDGAAFAVVVIDHESRAQVAQLEAWTEPDLIATQLMLACLFYGQRRRPWLAIERTGGYGLALIDTLFHEYGYRQMYTRRKADAPTGSYADRLGWDTTRVTKGLLHEEAMALLREGTHGIRSVRLARQMETYVRKSSGRTGPESGATSDLLLAWMIAQTVASEKPPRVERAQRPRVSTGRRIRYAVTGY
jgi:hypothetical protein